MLKPVSNRSLIPDGPAQINAVADFAQQGWTFRVGTAGERAALPSDEKFVGLTWQDTDGAQRRYVWMGSSWVSRSWFVGGDVLVTTATTGIATIPHNLGATPDWVNFTPVATGVDALDTVLAVMRWSNPTSANFQIRAKRTDTNTWFNSAQTFVVSYAVGKN